MRLFLPQGQFSQKARWAVSKDGGSHHVVVRPPSGGSARGHSAPGRPDPALQPQGGLALTPAGPSQANTRTQDPHTARTRTHTHTHTRLLFGQKLLYNSLIFTPCSFQSMLHSDTSEKFHFLCPSYHPKVASDCIVS